MTVIMYAPGVVPPPLPWPPVPPPPPQARIPPTTVAMMMSSPIPLHLLNLLPGSTRMRMQARIAPLPEIQRPPGRTPGCNAPWVDPVVVIVKFAVIALPFVRFRVFVGLKLKTGKLVAPSGLDVIDAVRVTTPVNPAWGVTVIVDWLFAGCPGTTTIEFAETVKPGATTSMIDVPLAPP